MSVQDKLNRLQDRYVKWYVENVSDCKEDALQSWWERTREMERWSTTKGCFVPMSDSQALRTMTRWFKGKEKRGYLATLYPSSPALSYSEEWELREKLYAYTITAEERERLFAHLYQS